MCYTFGNMIDWYSGLVGYDGSALKLNKLLELTPGGEIKWSSERKLEARGSYDNAVLLGRSVPNRNMLAATRDYNLVCSPVCLYISGNPSKFLQGHNVFGPPVASLGPVIRAVIRALPGEVRPSDADSPLLPSVGRTRVDITTSVDLGTHKLVHEWLKTAATNTRSRHGRALVSGDTVYWGQHSRRWTMKAYCKACELREHGPGDLVFRSELEQYCQGQLRLELTLRGMELKPRGALNESLIWDFMDRIEVGVMKANINPDGVHPDLPGIVQFTLTRWIAGEDVRHSLSKPTFYRHHRIILDQLGLDISLNYEKKTVERIVFDLDYLKAHEIKVVPSSFQGKLFKPEPSPVFPAH